MINNLINKWINKIIIVLHSVYCVSIAVYPDFIGEELFPQECPDDEENAEEHHVHADLVDGLCHGWKKVSETLPGLGQLENAEKPQRPEGSNGWNLASFSSSSECGEAEVDKRNNDQNGIENIEGLFEVLSFMKIKGNG